MSGRTAKVSSGCGNAEAVRDQFTRQAHDFTTAAHATDSTLMAQYTGLISPQAGERIVDFAAGPGLVAAALAPFRCRPLVMDLTPRMLAEAGRIAPDAWRVEGDATRAPLASGRWDAAISRLAFHHVPRPVDVLGEMVRAVRPGGRVVVNDIVTGEDAAESAVTEEIERLRDPSHVRCLTASELVSLFLSMNRRAWNTRVWDRSEGTECSPQIEICAIDPWMMTVDHDEWMLRVYPPEENRPQVRERLEALADDGSWRGGMRVVRDDVPGRLMISRRGIIISARRKE